jgi:DDE superfamily endonuclease
VALLAARSLKLRQALAAAKKAGNACVVVDGTLVPIDRVAADRPFCSGKHRRHGMNLQVIASPGGEIVWVSGLLPGAVHELSAARVWGIVGELAACGLIVLAGKGYAGAGEHIHVPCRGRGKPAWQKDANRAHAQLRSPGRARQRPAQDRAHLAQTPLLPVARRAAGQSDPRPPGPRDRRMKMLTEPFILILELPAWASAACLSRSCELEACRAAP